LRGRNQLSRATRVETEGEKQERKMMLREIFCQARLSEILPLRIPKAQAMMVVQQNRFLMHLSDQLIGLRSTPGSLALIR
jgi:hypothetical protein